MVLCLAPGMHGDEDLKGSPFTARIGHAALSPGIVASGGGKHAPAAVHVVAC